jgi:hypothetical protein
MHSLKTRKHSSVTSQNEPWIVAGRRMESSCYTVDAKAMNLLEDHGKILLEILKNAATAASAGTNAPSLQYMQHAKHLYKKCLSKSVSTKV